MGIAAWLVCEEAKEMILLGKIVRPSAGERYFHRGPHDAVPNSEKKPLVKGIMKFLAMNMGKTIRVVPDQPFDDFDVSMDEIQGDEEGWVSIGDEIFEDGIPFEEYLRDFRG